MLRFKLLDDKKNIKLVDFDLNGERKDLYSFFKRKSKKAAFNSLVDRGVWDGMDPFMTQDGIIKVGLWNEIYNFANRYGYDCEIENIDSILNLSLNRENYLKYVNNLLDGVVDEHNNPIIPRDYQIEGAYRAIKYKFCTQELATSAGKTLIFYIYNSFLREAKKISTSTKSLIIVPNVSLVNQTAEKFDLYSVGKKPWKICKIGGKDKFDEAKFNESEIVISTYQSLQNIDPKIFKSFSIVQVDECHKSRGEVINRILGDCVNWQYRLGLSGTVKIEEEFSDFFRIQETVGPLIMVLSASHLIDNKYSPNVKINIVKLNYDRTDPVLNKYWELKKNGMNMYSDPKEFGKDMINIEKGFIFQSERRLNFISDLTKRFSKNTLILFSDIQNKYGVKIYEKLLEWNKNTFYIDGKVDSLTRDNYKKIMETEEATIIVASY